MLQIRNVHSVTLLLPGELVLVGRSETCDVRLDDPSASRIHCRLLARNGKVFLTDAGSRWGTFVNGRRVADCELRPGDEITIGETVLRLEADGTPNATTLARQSELHRPLLSSEQPAAWPASPQLPMPGAGTCESPPMIHPEDEVFEHREPGRSAASQGAAWPVKVLPEPVRKSLLPPAEDFRDGDASPQQDQVLAGQCFAGCLVRELLTRTSSGQVFRAKNLATQQDVALKIFDQAVLSDDIARQRFFRATELLRGLRHPHLVALLQAGLESGQYFTVSEFVEGENAAALIQRIGIVGMLDWRTTLRIGRDLCAALVFASEQGIVHRHITPQNILIRKSDGAALLNDLLLARSLNDDGAGRLTQAGELLGTIPFLSPEQVGSGHPVDHRSDLYQLGATLYALLTGRPPAEGRNVADVVQRILTDTPQPPSRIHLAIPALLEGVILRLLEKRPEDRYVSAFTLQRELNRVSKYLGEPHSSL